ncbi:hypothetical protein L1987_47907 [Smallanthus sonchifolius]|uniref:Uncharacterized protein n=1 Tax=Smallanthus sonchifolius TaxID=185202 RepID=A0ACB9FRD5_9ASTR|nr:hypothetical protein L1987_47907 [Smallanthus sonchifolius]
MGGKDVVRIVHIRLLPSAFWSSNQPPSNISNRHLLCKRLSHICYVQRDIKIPAKKNVKISLSSNSVKS